MTARPPASEAPRTSLHWQEPQPPQAVSLMQSRLCISTGRVHAAQKLPASRSWFPLTGSRQSCRDCGNACGSLCSPGSPCSAVSCESAFSSFPAKVKPAPSLTGPQFLSCLLSSYTAAWIWRWGGHPCREWSPPRPGGRDEGCGIQEGKHCRQTPESSSEFAARDSREGEKNRQRLLRLDS